MATRINTSAECVPEETDKVSDDEEDPFARMTGAEADEVEGLEEPWEEDEE